MEDAYVMEEIRSFPGKGDAWKREICEGDVILERWSGYLVVPAILDTVKPIEVEELTSEPEKPQERLLRIKQLREDGAVVAILRQTINYPGDMRVTEEYESLHAVSLGEIFSVNIKQPVMDALIQPMHSFVIYRKNAPIEPWRPTQPEHAAPAPTSGKARNEGKYKRTCGNCGYITCYDDADAPPRFCLECGCRL